MESAMRQITHFLQLINPMGVKKNGGRRNGHLWIKRLKKQGFPW